MPTRPIVFVALAASLAAGGLAPFAAQAGEPRREVVFIDDFIRDPELRSGDWAVNGPAAASVLARLPGAGSLAAPSLKFDRDHGLGLTAGAGPGGIQTQYAYTPPFRVTATGTASAVGALEILLATADANAGVGIVGGPAGFALVAAAGAGKPWGSGAAPLSPSAPAAGKPYAFIIDVDGQGLAHVYLSSAGQVLGAEQAQVGSGPFYVVLGQAPGAVTAYWRGVTLSRTTP